MASKTLTATQVRALYKAGLNAYLNSYAMMVDDILEGMKPLAKAYGKTVCYDHLWFQAMAAHICQCRKWENIGENHRGNIIKLVKAGN